MPRWPLRRLHTPSDLQGSSLLRRQGAHAQGPSGGSVCLDFGWQQIQWRKAHTVRKRGKEEVRPQIRSWSSTRHQGEAPGDPPARLRGRNLPRPEPWAKDPAAGRTSLSASGRKEWQRGKQRKTERGEPARELMKRRTNKPTACSQGHTSSSSVLSLGTSETSALSPSLVLHELRDLEGLQLDKKPGKRQGCLHPRRAFLTDGSACAVR